MERALAAAELSLERDLLGVGGVRAGGVRQSENREGQRGRRRPPSRTFSCKSILPALFRNGNGFAYTGGHSPTCLTRCPRSFCPDPAAVCAALAPLLLDERRARIDAARRGAPGGPARRDREPARSAQRRRRAAQRRGVRHPARRRDRERRAVPVLSRRSRRAARSGSTSSATRRSTHAVAALRARRLRRLRGRAGRRAATVEDLDFARPAAVMVGNEHDGLTGEAIDAADRMFSIPMAGLTASLNLSVATALIAERAAALRRRAFGRAAISTRRRAGAAGALLRRVGARRRARGALPRRPEAERGAPARSGPARRAQPSASASRPASAVCVAPTGSSPRNETA